MAARLELKYLVDLETRLRLQPLLRSRLLPGEHVDGQGSYPVLSLYYDGEDLPLYLDKLAGVERRVKVRLRTYGWSFESSPLWFLEAKHRDDAAIAKRRLALARGAIEPLRPESWDALGEAAGPFLQARECLRLGPTIQVWYLREALVSSDGELRLTWDSCLRALYPGERMSTDLLYDTTRALIPDTQAVLEVKAAQTLPAWLTRLVRAGSLVPESVSKYVRAVDRLGLSRKVLTTC